MAIQNNESLVTPYFKASAELDEAASKSAGRPIYRDIELVEIRIAGDRHYQPTKMAHEFWTRVDGVDMTYADRWPEQYRKFKDSKTQVADGTPLSELPFLTEAKRSELRGLRVYTAEALASMDGTNLKALGSEGRKLKEQATAYIESANGSANTSQMAAELAELRATVAAMKAGRSTEEVYVPAPVDVFEQTADYDTVREEIRAITGKYPVGRPSLHTLQQTLQELKQEA